MPDVTPHPKEAQTQPGRPRRYRRKVAGPKQWAAIRLVQNLDQETLSEGSSAVELHHLVPRSQGGQSAMPTPSSSPSGRSGGDSVTPQNENLGDGQKSVVADAGEGVSTPDERLETLRFFAREVGYDSLPKSLFDWMQEIEAQLANIRSRLNEKQKKVIW